MKVLKYEVLRIILTKKYFYFILIISLYSYDVLSRLIINGSEGTAPFSKLSYSNFAALVNPMLLSILILLCMSVFSEKELSVRKIIFSTPIHEWSYYIIKSAAVLISITLLSLAPIILSFIFYGYMFNFFSYKDFIVPIMAFMAPPIVFILGASMALGKVSIKLLYILLPLVFFSGLFNLELPLWLDLCGNNFLLAYPRVMYASGLEKTMPYILPQNFILSRIAFTATGLLLCKW